MQRSTLANKKRKRTNEPIKNRVQSKRYVTLAKRGRHDWTGLVPEDVTLPWVPDAFSRVRHDASVSATAHEKSVAAGVFSARFQRQVNC